MASNKPKILDHKWTSQQIRKGEIKLKSGKRLKITLAISPEEVTRGLSGVQDKDYGDDQGMLFFTLTDQYRRFWMPDTYFDLDIFFLDKNLKVLDVDRNVPHHPGMDQSKQEIATTRVIYCRHVLEIKSSSPLAKEIKPGDQLNWVSQPTLLQIESSIRSGL